MRILQVIPHFYPAQVFGGSTQVALDISKELVKRGHEVVVYTSDAKDFRHRLGTKFSETEGIKIHYFSNISMLLVNSNVCFTPDLNRSMENNLKDFDIIHVHEFTTYQNIVVHHFSKKFNVPYILQAHGCLPKVSKLAERWVFDTLFGYKILKDASKVIAITQTEAQQYRDMGVLPEKICVIPNGIVLMDYSHLQKGFFRRKLCLDKGKKIILYLGRIHKTKRIDLLINAYARLTKDLRFNNLVLIIAGSDEGCLTELKLLAYSLGVSSSVIFTGFISSKDKLNALMDAEVFVTPSFLGFPLTFLEACSVGTPLITTTLGDRLGWIQNNVGYVTSPNPSELAEAIKKIVFSNQIRARFSSNCRSTLESFSIERIIDSIEQLYCQVSNN